MAEAAGVRADVLIDGEKVAAVGTGEEMERLADEDTQIVDVEGCLLFPGFIDAHTHFDLHVAGTVTADDFATGTRAAVRGGTTTIVDFGTQYEGESLADGLRNWHEKADGKCSCDYGFHMSISDWNPSVSRELDDMMEAGITSFKLYMTYDTQVDDKTIFEILRRLKEVGGITGVHCENSGMIAALQAEAKAAGRMGVESHPATRPAAAEAEAIDRLLRLAEVVDIPVIVVHLTCREGYDVIMEARRRGQKVYAETCPQYLLMDDSLYGLAGMEGAKYVCAPPLRKQEDSACLWKALADGTIQTVSTDTAALPQSRRRWGRMTLQRFREACPELRQGARCSTPTAWTREELQRKKCASFCRKIPPSCTECIPQREPLPREATRTLLSCAPVWRIWLRLRTRYRMWITLPLREGS